MARSKRFDSKRLPDQITYYWRRQENPDRPVGYRIQIYIGRDGAGKQIMRSRTLRCDDLDDGLAEAIIERKRFRRELGVTTPEDAKGATLGDLMDEWIRIGEPKWSPTSLENHKFWARVAKAELGAAAPLHGFARQQIIALYQRMRTEGHKLSARKGQPLKESSIQRFHNALSSAFAEAVYWEWIKPDENPMALVRAPQRQEPKKHAPSNTQIRFVLGLVEQTPMWALYLRLAATTGLRRGELVNLRWSDIERTVRKNRDGTESTVGVVEVKSNMVVAEGRRHEKTRKNKKSVMVMLLQPELEHIDRYRAHLERDILGAKLPDDTYLFFSNDPHKSIHPSSVTHWWKRVKDNANAAAVAEGRPAPIHEDTRLHDVRGYVGTYGVGRGHDRKTVQGHLGHASMQATEKYVAEMDENRVVMAEDLSRALDDEE